MTSLDLCDAGKKIFELRIVSRCCVTGIFVDAKLLLILHVL